MAFERNQGDINALIAEVRKSFADNPLRKDTVNLGTGLVTFDLQAPAKDLHPVNTPIRNRLPRVKGKGDLATRWKVVTGLSGSGFDAIPYVAEGGRSGVMTLTTSNKNSPYTTIGEEANLTYEAWSGAAGFEDEKARTAIRLLQKMFLKEENSLLGGNYSLQLGSPAAPTVSVASTGGSIAAGTYKVTCAALTYEGWRNWQASGSLVVNGLPTQLTIVDPVGAQFIVNGGTSNKSATTTAGSAITGSGVIQASTPVLNGAMAYAWFVDNGAGGASTLQAVTTLNSVSLTALSTSGQNLTAINGDFSYNQGGTIGGIQVVTAMDGLLYAAYASSASQNTTSFIPGAYVKALPTGVSGTGTTLTSSGRGTCTEIDTMLQAQWDNYQISPSVLFMNSQQIKDVTTKCLNTSSSPLLRINTDTAEGYQKLMAGGIISYYFNPFTQEGGMKIPVVIHPNLPPGTIMGWAENLPMQYQSSECPNIAEVHTRRDYYEIDWPARTRKYESGVYSEETLAVYFPPGMGIITNIAPG